MVYRSSVVKQYRRYRKAGMALHHKVIDKYVDDQVLNEAASSLGLGEEHQLVLDTEDDLSVMMEYSIYEKRREKQNFIERYQHEVGGRNRVERDLLTAKANARTGLFRVDEIWSDRYSLRLSDLLDERIQIELTDMSFSQSIKRDVIIFFRPLEFSEFTTTSGVAFTFSQEMETELKECWAKWDKLDSAERYVQIFKLYKSKGLPTAYV